jgi:hypothetical protein
MVASIVLGIIIAIQQIAALYERGKLLNEIHRLTELVAAKDLGEFKACENRPANKERIDLFSEREKKRGFLRSGPFKEV